jgi:hypothetical protein
MSSYTKNDTIFVQIAAYRDPELHPTVEDLFKKAKKPENITVSIAHDHDLKDGDNYHFQVPQDRKNQVIVHDTDYRKSTGPNPSKRLAQSSWSGQRWTLQIDCHMRFDQDWDEIIVKDIKAIGDEGKGVIFTNSPSSYNTKSDEVSFYQNFSNAIAIFFSNPDFRPYSSPNVIYKTRPGVILLGSFYFGDSGVIQNNKFNPNLMHYDEMTNSLRYFTSGANIYNYAKTIIAHLWALDNPNYVAGKTNAYKGNPVSEQMCLQMCGIKKSNNPEVFKIMKNYDLNTVRTLRDYERFSGVSFKERKLREFTKHAAHEEWQEVAGINDVKTLFSNPILNN